MINKMEEAAFVKIFLKTAAKNRLRFSRIADKS
jgi:hypothetical protein